MRVNDRNTLGSTTVESGRTAEIQKSDSHAPRTASADQNGDQVEFSAGLSRLSRAISVDSAQRSNRVQALAASYQAGAYQPNSLGASRGMITEAAGAGRL